MRLSLLSLILLLASCSVGPTKIVRVSPTGTRTEITTSGITVLTRNDYEHTHISDGEFSATHNVHKKDEQGIIRIPAQEAVGTAATGIIVPGINAVTK